MTRAARLSAWVSALAAAVALSGLFWWWAFSYLPAGQGTWRDRPPQRFQGDTAAFVVFTTEGRVQAMCPQVRYAVGCTVGDTIYVPNACRWRDPYAGLLCHELGHINSWSAFHER